MRKINMFAACMMCTCLALALDAASFQQEIAEKAKGLEIVGGGIPGVILVAGEPAFPLVWGRIGNARVPVAAATRMGNGRVVALSHQLFVLEEGSSCSRRSGGSQAWSGRRRFTMTRA